MFDAKKLLDQLVGSGAAGGFAGGLAGGTLASMLTKKKGKKLAGSALKLGGLALVGGLAYKAWQNYHQGSLTTSDSGIPIPPTDGAFLPHSSDETATNSLSLLLARAMISAAKADGQIDVQESQAILNQINSLNLPAEDKAFLFEEYGRPLDIEGLTADVDSPEHAAEVYAASAIMVDPPSAPEKLYLDTLARSLRLEAGLIQQIQHTIATNSGA